MAIVHGVQCCNLVVGGVHRVPTSAAGKHMKEGWEIHTAYVLYQEYHYLLLVVYIDISRRVDHVVWKVLILTQPDPTVSTIC